MLTEVDHKNSEYSSSKASWYSTIESKSTVHWTIGEGVSSLGQKSP